MHPRPSATTKTASGPKPWPTSGASTSRCSHAQASSLVVSPATRSCAESTPVANDRVDPEAHLVLSAFLEHDVLRRPVRIERAIPGAADLDRFAGVDMERSSERVVHLPP